MAKVKSFIKEEIKCDKCSKVLIIDDNGFNIFSLKLLIQDYFDDDKFECEEAYNGE